MKDDLNEKVCFQTYYLVSRLMAKCGSGHHNLETPRWRPPSRLEIRCAQLIFTRRQVLMIITQRFLGRQHDIVYSVCSMCSLEHVFAVLLHILYHRMAHMLHATLRCWKAAPRRLGMGRSRPGQDGADWDGWAWFRVIRAGCRQIGAA